MDGRKKSLKFVSFLFLLYIIIIIGIDTIWSIIYYFISLPIATDFTDSLLHYVLYVLHALQNVCGDSWPGFICWLACVPSTPGDLKISVPNETTPNKYRSSVLNSSKFVLPQAMSVCAYCTVHSSSASYDVTCIYMYKTTNDEVYDTKSRPLLKASYIIYVWGLWNIGISRESCRNL
jgi:hypothetical protein